MNLRRQSMNNLQIEQNQYSFLSCQTKSILLGSLLGDGSLKIHSGYKNARFSFCHSINQSDYFMWKRNQLKPELSGAKDYWEQLAANSHKDEYSGHKLRYQSRALPGLTYLYNLTHKKSEKGNIKIRREWLNLLTPLSLAIWWCDGGSLVSNTKQGVFSTDGFSLEDLEKLDRYLKIVWHLSTKIRAVGKTRKDGGERYRIWLNSQTELEKFLRIIIPFIPTLAMLRKVLILYKDSELQQRWISVVLELNANFSRAEVENLISERKAKFKHFQRMI